jgi:hypothetical protein
MLRVAHRKSWFISMLEAFDRRHHRSTKGGVLG